MYLQEPPRGDGASSSVNFLLTQKKISSLPNGGGFRYARKVEQTPIVRSLFCSHKRFWVREKEAFAGHRCARCVIHVTYARSEVFPGVVCKASIPSDCKLAKLASPVPVRFSLCVFSHFPLSKGLVGGQKKRFWAGVPFNPFASVNGKSTVYGRWDLRHLNFVVPISNRCFLIGARRMTESQSPGCLAYFR